MKQPIDLRPDHAKIVHEIVARHLPEGVSVRVFGSRAKWTAKPHSDLDLALKGKEPLPSSVLRDLADAFAESDLPFRVDVVDWHTVAPSLQAVIDRDSLRLTVPLGEVVKLLSGGTPSKSNSLFWNGNIPWLTPKDMGQWRGKTETHVTEAAIGNGTRLAPENSIFIAVRGMSLHNEIRIVRSAQPIAFNQDIKALVAGSSIDPDFLYYALTSAKPLLLGQVSSAGHGTGVLETDRLRLLAIPSLSMDDQRSIASIIRSLDNKIELNRRMNETLEQMAQAIFRDWFVDFGPVRRKQDGARDPIAIMGGLVQDAARAAELAGLFPDAFGDDGLPVGWFHDRLAKFTQIQNGYAFKSRDWQSFGVPVIKIGSVKPSVVDLTQVSFISPSLADEKEMFRLKVGDVVVGLTGYVGETGRVPPTEHPPMLNQRVAKFSTDGKFSSFVFSCVRAPEFKCFAEAKAHGSAQANLSAKDILEYELINSGHLIIESFEVIANPLYEQTLQNYGESRLLAETRDYLLPKLMSGEVRVREAEELAEQVL